MKFVYVLHEPLPSESTNTEQVMRAAVAMAALGEEVVVTTPRVQARFAGAGLPPEIAAFYGIATPPPVETVEPDTASGAAPHGEPVDLRLTLAELPGPRWMGSALTRPWHDARAVAYARRVRADVLYVRDPIPLALALRSGVPVVFETYRYDLNIRRAWAPWRALCYGHPSLVGVVTHSGLARDSFLTLGFRPDSVLVAHNGYDPPPEGIPGRDKARSLLGIDPYAKLVVYAGGVARSKGLDVLIDVARLLPGIRFLVVGHVPGSEGEAWMRDAIATAGLTNVDMRPRVPPGEVRTVLAAADVLFIPTSAAPLIDSGRTVLPMKTFAYLGAGRPIVAPDLADLREVLESRRNALLVPPDDPPEAARAIRSLFEDRALAEELSRAAVRTAAEHSWSARAHRIRSFVRERLAARHGGA